MKQVVLIHTAFISGHLLVHHGLAAISAFLKKRGISVSLVIVESDDPQKYADIILEKKPLWVGFTFVANYFSVINRLAKEIKRRKKDIVLMVGGKGIIAQPEMFCRMPSFDLACLFEGEEVSYELTQRLIAEGDWQSIEGTWARDEEEKIVKNGYRPLVENLDYFDMPDYDLFGRALFQKYPAFSFSRGCPYFCSHCVNSAIKKIQKGDFFRVRRKSVAKAIDEIKYYCAKYELGYVFVDDETFFANRRWALDFLAAYKKHICLPLTCQTRPETVTEELMECFRDAGGVRINIGVESGNEYIRKHVLRRHINEDTLRKAFRIAHRSGIYAAAFTMIGIPGETFEMCLDTIDMNNKILPNSANPTVYYPYPGTPLGDECYRNGTVIGESVGFSEESILNLESFSSENIMKAKKWMQISSVRWETFHNCLNNVDWMHMDATLVHDDEFLMITYVYHEEELPYLLRCISSTAFAWGRAIPHMVIYEHDIKGLASLCARYSNVTCLNMGSILREEGRVFMTNDNYRYVCFLSVHEWVHPNIRYMFKLIELRDGDVVSCESLHVANHNVQYPESVKNFTHRKATYSKGLFTQYLFPVKKIKHIINIVTYLNHEYAKYDMLNALVHDQNDSQCHFVTLPLMFIEEYGVLQKIESMRVGRKTGVSAHTLEKTLEFSRESVLLRAYFRQIVKNIQRSHDMQGFALYGLNNHTDWLWGILENIGCVPEIIFVDTVECNTYKGISVDKVNNINAYKVSVVLISDDLAYFTMQQKITSILNNPSVEVINPYEELFQAPFAKT